MFIWELEMFLTYFLFFLYVMFYFNFSQYLYNYFLK